MKDKKYDLFIIFLLFIGFYFVLYLSIYFYWFIPILRRRRKAK